MRTPSAVRISSIESVDGGVLSRRNVALVAGFGFYLLAGLPAASQEFWAHTYLVGINVGSSRSDLARALSIGGYELSDGTPVSFEYWYQPRFPDVNFRFLTELNANLGLAWGFSLGEAGPKYRISPGLWVGFVSRTELSSRSSLTFSAVTMLGGDFRERTCLADFEELDGLQTVNCRLAASPLPPEETLKFLANIRGYSETRISVQYELRF
jgi:hypothetical protein